jgi:hypothetical protein
VRLTGVAASPGFGAGPALVVRTQLPPVPEPATYGSPVRQ